MNIPVAQLVDFQALEKRVSDLERGVVDLQALENRVSNLDIFLFIGLRQSSTHNSTT